MIQRWLAALLVVALLSPQVAAQPDPSPVPPPADPAPVASATVMVLPIDGDADPAVRLKLTSSVEAVVKTSNANMKAGTTTLGETATAIGCDPTTPECAESVRTTLSVDVLIYGKATNKDGAVELVIRKKEKDKEVEEVTTMVTSIPVGPEPANLGADIQRLLGGTAVVVTCPDNALPGPDGKCPEKPPVVTAKKKSRTDRALGVTALIGAGVLMIGGLTLWNEKSKKQDQIDAAPTATLEDFQDLEILEDDAGKKALYGNLLVLGAIGATAVGIWLLRRDRKAQRDAVMVTPTITPTGAGVMLTIGASR